MRESKRKGVKGCREEWVLPSAYHLAKRAAQTDDTVQAIAWKAQKRLCGRYQHMIRAGKLKVQVCTAIARELTGFLWAMTCAVQTKAQYPAYSIPIRVY